ncbi:acylphosphatase [Patescibacteria group bacterium]|nr:acylphosphatase [Patescibacteria group bacterium]MBU1124146.1 acylphosphatase [Patescibacteria group bacterium]
MSSKLIKIMGKVQGVFFRAHAQEKANELGVNGWVKNCSDGSVEIHVEGLDFAVKEFVEWSEHGPETAVVEFFEVEDAQEENLSMFEIKYD